MSVDESMLNTRTAAWCCAFPIVSSFLQKEVDPRGLIRASIAADSLMAMARHG